MLSTALSAALSTALPAAVSAAAKAGIPVGASQVESLQSESAVPLASADIEHLVYRLTSVAKMDAEVRLGQAAQLTQTFGPKTLADWEMGTETMLLVANRLFDAGSHGNYVRSAELAQVLIDDYQRVPVMVDSRSLSWAEARSKAAGAVIPDLATRSRVRHLWKGLRERMEPRVNALWVRAPLLILLLAWFALGLAGGTLCLLLGNLYSRDLLTAITAAASEIWGLGFLALVGLGFYLRIRNVRFGRER